MFFKNRLFMPGYPALKNIDSEIEKF